MKKRLIFSPICLPPISKQPHNNNPPVLDLHNMDPVIHTGTISFINHEKQFATIEYDYKGKQKSVNFKTAAGSGKKAHQFMIGDKVSFTLRLSDRGDKMAADGVRFMHNTSIDLLIQKAHMENRFSGYLKIVDGKFFVKEVDSYILFPLKLSPWEIPPAESASNVAIAFSLTDIDKPKSIRAELFSHQFIPEYKMAQRHYQEKTPVEAWVSRISPHAIYLELFTASMEAKIPLTNPKLSALNPGDSLQVMITWLTPEKIVVEPL